MWKVHVLCFVLLLGHFLCLYQLSLQGQGRKKFPSGVLPKMSSRKCSKHLAKQFLPEMEVLLTAAPVVGGSVSCCTAKSLPLLPGKKTLDHACSVQNQNGPKVVIPWKLPVKRFILIHFDLCTIVHVCWYMGRNLYRNIGGFVSMWRLMMLAHSGCVWFCCSVSQNSRCSVWFGVFGLHPCRRHYSSDCPYMHDHDDVNWHGQAVLEHASPRTEMNLA